MLKAGPLIIDSELLKGPDGKRAEMTIEEGPRKTGGWNLKYHDIIMFKGVMSFFRGYKFQVSVSGVYGYSQSKKC